MSTTPPLRLIPPPSPPLGTPPVVDHIRNDNVDTRWPELVGEHPRPFTMLGRDTFASIFQPATPDEVERALGARIEQQNRSLIPGPGDLVKRWNDSFQQWRTQITGMHQQLSELDVMSLYFGGHVGEALLSAVVGVGASIALESPEWQTLLDSVISPTQQVGLVSFFGSTLGKGAYYAVAYRAVKKAIESTNLSLWPTTLALGTSLCAVDLFTHDTLQAALTSLGLAHEEISEIIKSLPVITNINTISPPAVGGIVSTASFGLSLLGSAAFIKGFAVLCNKLGSK